MTSFRLVPFDRAARDLDRLMSAFVSAPSVGDAGPAYDISRLGENSYEVALAVPGFAEEQLEITVDKGTLFVRGKPVEGGAETSYLHRGIARGGFERRFALAEHVEVKGARLEHGILRVELTREVPEALKPRTITIGAGAGAPQLEAKAA